MRVVLDTNVLVSALIKPDSVPAQIIACTTLFDVVTSETILKELERVLHYDRIQKKYQLSHKLIEEYLSSIRSDSRIIGVSGEFMGVARDPDDDKFLACAEAAEADCIVSGDPHLTDLGSYLSIPILTPRQFLDYLQQEVLK